jgi:hypothetical protein
MRVLLPILLLAACGRSATTVPPRQISILWPQGHRLYVADDRQGVVRAFTVFDDPRAAAEGRAPGRTAVLDMKLDGARRRLWVLGPQGIDEYDAVSLRLLHRQPAAALTGHGRLALTESGRARAIAGD